MRQLLLLVLLTGIVTACGPVMTTEYEIVPPASDSGRMCANNCLLVKDSCEQNCWQQRDMCEQANNMERQLDYLAYATSRSANGQVIKRQPNDFYGSRWCEAESCLARCTQNYNVCHTNCGGKVIPHTYCSAFCD